MPSAGAPRQGEPAALEPSSEKPPNGDDSLKLNASSPVSNFNRSWLLEDLSDVQRRRRQW